MPDMLAKLYNLPNKQTLYQRLESEGIELKRALTANKDQVVDFVMKTFSRNWANECECAMSRVPTSCFVAVDGGKVVGFACYDAVARNFFGPTGVAPEYRKRGIGEALLVRSLSAMRDEGYGYCIIGWVVDAVNFYKKTVGAIEIPDSFPGIYQDLLKVT